MTKNRKTKATETAEAKGYEAADACDVAAVANEAAEAAGTPEAAEIAEAATKVSEAAGEAAEKAEAEAEAEAESETESVKGTEPVKETESEITSTLIPKGIEKYVDIRSLNVNYDLNPRHRNNYDVPEMMERITAAGRILDPIFVRKSDLTVLRGNRRTLAGCRLHADPSTSDQLKGSLERVRVIVFDGLKPHEEKALIYDHGGQKPLSGSEIIESCWELSKMFFSEAKIIAQLYYALAQFTGRMAKVTEIQNLEGQAKTEALWKWLHGTVGNFILSVGNMGPYVRKQFVLQYRAKEGSLGPDEKVEIQTTLSRTVVADLNKAKNEDEGSTGKGWTPENGGLVFNALLAKLKAGEAKSTRKQPSPRDLKDRANQFQDYGIRAAFQYASGDPAEGMDTMKKKLVDFDGAGYRARKVNEVLAECRSTIKDQKVNDLVLAIVQGEPDDVVRALKPFCEVKTEVEAVV